MGGVSDEGSDTNGSDSRGTPHWRENKIRALPRSLIFETFRLNYCRKIADTSVLALCFKSAQELLGSSARVVDVLIGSIAFKPDFCLGLDCIRKCMSVRQQSYSKEERHYTDHKSLDLVKIRMLVSHVGQLLQLNSTLCIDPLFSQPF
jgi:hypothetical protein